MKKSLKIFGLLVAVLLVVVIARTFLVESRQIRVDPVPEIAFDEKILIARFTKALQIPTVSHDDPQKVDSAAFIAMHRYLEKTFPLVHQHLTLEKIGGYSLLYRWKGADPKRRPVVLMAHMDVVPAEQSGWKYPPFEGTVADNYIWGRGTLDDKSSLIAILESLEYLLSREFQPQQTIYLAFGHNEEAGGAGAAAIASYLDTQGVKPELILDEGGAILDAVVPGLVSPSAMIGTSEKGYVTLELMVHQAGGHSSAPPRHTAIGILSNAVRRLEENPMPARISGSMEQMLDYLGPELPLFSRAIVVNRWLFQPLITFGLSRMAATDATIRTTTAVTMIEGGIKENVLPRRVTATVNFRIRPGETVNDVIDHVRETIQNEDIKIVQRPHSVNPSPVSSPESAEFTLLHRTIREIYPHVVVVPGIVIGATDARHFSHLSANVFRFAPFQITMKDFEGVHGVNERIGKKSYIDMVRFYVRFLQNLSAESAQ